MQGWGVGSEVWAVNSTCISTVLVTSVADLAGGSLLGLPFGLTFSPSC